MRRARICGALVGVEAVTSGGLKDVYKGFNLSGDDLVARLRAFRNHGVRVLGSFIVGLPSDRPHTFEATVALTEVAKKAESTCAIRAVTPCPGTLDFEEWAEDEPSRTDVIDGAPVRGRLAFVLVSNFYRQMYANTGIATDSARVARVCPVRSLDRKGVPAFLRGPSDGGAGTAELNAAHP